MAVTVKRNMSVKKDSLVQAMEENNFLECISPDNTLNLKSLDNVSGENEARKRYISSKETVQHHISMHKKMLKAEEPKKTNGRVHCGCII